MVLLTRLAKQVYRRSNEELLGMHMRLLMALSYLRDHDGADIVEEMQAATRFRGLQCGVKYAEGFVPCATWLRGTTTRLLP